MKLKLAEALLRRKELAAKVEQLKTIQAPALFQTRVQRVKVTDEVENITVNVPVLSASQVTQEFDHYSRQLRLVDAAIQQANWTTEIEADLRDYEAPTNLTRKGVASVDG